MDVFKETPNIPLHTSAYVPCELFLESKIRVIPLFAISCSSGFRKSGLDLNPFHQVVKEVFEGDGDCREGALDDGGESDEKAVKDWCC